MSHLQQKTGQKKTESSISQDVSLWSLAWDLGWMITIPLVVFAVGGAMIDKKINTSPWFLLGGIGLALVITSIMVYGKTIRAIEVLGKANGTNDDSSSK